MSESAKAFLVTSGSHSDYGVIAVFSTRANAEEYIAGVYGKVSPSSDGPDIEEFDLDPGLGFIRDGLRPWLIQLKRDGDVIQAHTTGGADHVLPVQTSVWRDKSVVNVDAWARDREHAIKIAGEARTRLIANGEF